MDASAGMTSETRWLACPTEALKTVRAGERPCRALVSRIRQEKEL